MIGHVSGGHLNPAVSLGAIVAGRISVFKGLVYMPAQVVGGELHLFDMHTLLGFIFTGI